MKMMKKMMPELTPSEARRVKAAHVLCGMGIVAYVVAQGTLVATIAHRKGVRAGERRTLRRIVEGEAIEDMIPHRGGRRCCVSGHHHRGCCIHDDVRGGHRKMHHGMHAMMQEDEAAPETAE